MCYIFKCDNNTNQVPVEQTAKGVSSKKIIVMVEIERN